jgi:uncharacterized protein (DUF2336 family)
MTIHSSLINDLERALAAGTNAQRIAMLTRITDLFIADADRYSADQVNLFDEVISKLARAIEAKARAKLAIRLAQVPNAPTGVVRLLAFDDDIDVARPLLRGFERFEDADLVENAKRKSQLHLVAISERKSLSEVVTDILVERGDHQVVKSVAKNFGARFSDAGFRILVKRSRNDETLAMQVGARRDLPRQHFLRLLDQASAAVRARLMAEHPDAVDTVDGVLREVVGDIRSETRKVSVDYASARAEVEALSRFGLLGEAQIYGFARDLRFEQTVIALSLLCDVEIDAVERALLDPHHEMALILAKLADFSTTTAKAILLLKAADRGISAHDLDHALRSYDKLQPETAQRVLNFYRTRVKSEIAAQPALAEAG